MVDYDKINWKQVPICNYHVKCNFYSDFSTFYIGLTVVEMSGELINIVFFLNLYRTLK